MPRSRHSRAEVKKRNGPAPHPCVLCIDDSSDSLALRRQILEVSGFDVLTASTGQQGLQLLASNAVSAVVVDYEMPGMDGGAVSKAIRQNLKSRVPILLLSGYSQLPQRILKIVDGFVAKGESPAGFLESLKTIIKNKAGAVLKRRSQRSDSTDHNVRTKH